MISSREVTVSSTYISNVYELRTHIQYVVAQLQKRRARLTGELPPLVNAAPARGLHFLIKTEGPLVQTYAFCTMPLCGLFWYASSQGGDVCACWYA